MIIDLTERDEDDLNLKEINLKYHLALLLKKFSLDYDVNSIIESIKVDLSLESFLDTIKHIDFSTRVTIKSFENSPFFTIHRVLFEFNAI